MIHFSILPLSRSAAIISILSPRFWNTPSYSGTPRGWIGNPGWGGAGTIFQMDADSFGIKAAFGHG